MKKDGSICPRCYPADYHVRADHTSVRGEPESHPTQCLHSRCERDGFGNIVKVPVQLVDRIGSTEAQRGHKGVGGQILSPQNGQDSQEQ